MQTKFSKGIDGISNNLLKKIINVIKGPFCYVVNTSLLYGIFPKDIKVAKVIFLLKFGDQSCVENYRPISLLLVLSKVLEKTVYLKLVSHMGKMNVIFPKQFGF